MPETTIIFGKPTIRKDEEEAFHTFGRALAHTDPSSWMIAQTPGSCERILTGYNEERSIAQTKPEAQYIPERTSPPNHSRVVVFTDRAYQTTLDQRIPDWRTRGWAIIHNPGDIRSTSRLMTYIIEERGHRLSEDGNKPTCCTPI